MQIHSFDAILAEKESMLQEVSYYLKLYIFQFDLIVAFGTVSTLFGNFNVNLIVVYCLATQGYN